MAVTKSGLNSRLFNLMSTSSLLLSRIENRINKQPLLKFLIAFVPTVFLYGLSFFTPMISMLGLAGQIIIPVVTLTTCFLSGKIFFKTAYNDIKNIVDELKEAVKYKKSPKFPTLGMGFLVSLSIITSILYGVVLGASAPLVVFIAPLFTLAALSISRYIKDLNKSYTEKTISDKLKIFKQKLTVLESAKITKNQILEIRPGKVITVDSLLLSDYAEVKDCSLVTGETDKTLNYKKHQKLYAGMTNTSTETIKIQAIVDGKDSLYHKTISALQANKFNNTSKFIDGLIKIFVPFVLVAALASFTYWSIAAGFSYGFTTLMDILFAACPCALGIARDLPIGFTKKMLFDDGIVLNNDAVIEKFNSSNTLVFDKTGTLTHLKLVNIMHIKTVEQVTSFELEQIILSAEQKRLEHTRQNCRFAELISYYLKSNGVSASGLDLDINTSKSNGIEITVKSRNIKIHIGAPGYLHNLGYASSDIDNLSETSDTNVYVGIESKNNKRITSVLGFQQQLRADAKKTISHLVKKGFDVHMLTGDANTPAGKIATELNIKNYRAEATPSEKALYIEDLVRQGKKVTMIGDGFNDYLPAQRCNAGSIAIGKNSIMNGFFDITIEKLSDILKLKPLFKKSHNNQLTVLAFAIGFITVMVLLAAVILPIQGAVNMMACFGFCMAFSSAIATGLSCLLPKQLSKIISKFNKSIVKSDNTKPITKPTHANKNNVSGKKPSTEQSNIPVLDTSLLRPDKSFIEAKTKVYNIDITVEAFCDACTSRHDNAIADLKTKLNITYSNRSDISNQECTINLLLETNNPEQDFTIIEKRFCVKRSKNEMVVEEVTQQPSLGLSA